MNDSHKWTLPVKKRGRTLKMFSVKQDPILIDAIAQLSAAETERTGSVISQGTIVTNLLTRDSDFHRKKRSELSRTYLQLKRGNQNERITTREDAIDHT